MTLRLLVLLALVGCGGAASQTSETTPGGDATEDTEDAPRGGLAQLPRFTEASGPGWKIEDEVFEGAISGIRVRATAGWRFAPPLLESRPGAELAMVDATGEAALVLMSERAPGLTDDDATAEIMGQLGADNQRGTLSVQFLGSALVLRRFESEGSHLAIGTRCENDVCLTLSLTAGSTMAMRRAADELPSLERIEEASRVELERTMRSTNQWPERVFRHAAFRGGKLVIYPLGVTMTVPDGLWRVEATQGSPAMVELTELSTGAHFAMGIAPLEDEHEGAHEDFLTMVGLGTAPVDERAIGETSMLISTEPGAGQAGSIARATANDGEFLVWWYARARPSLEESAKPLFDAIEASIELSDAIDPIAVSEGRFVDRRMGITFPLPDGTELQGAPEPPPNTALYLFEGDDGRTQVAITHGDPTRIAATLEQLAQSENGAREDGAIAFDGGEGSAPGIAFQLGSRLVQIQGESEPAREAIRARMETLEQP